MVLLRVQRNSYDVTLVLLRVRRKSTGFTMVLLRVQIKSNGFTKVLLKYNKKSIKSIGFISKMARDTPGHPKSIGLPRSCIRTIRNHKTKQALYTKWPGTPRDTPGHTFDPSLFHSFFFLASTNSLYFSLSPVKSHSPNQF